MFPKVILGIRDITGIVALSLGAVIITGIYKKLTKGTDYLKKELKD